MKSLARTILSIATVLLFVHVGPSGLTTTAAQSDQLCSQQLGGLGGLPTMDGTIRGDVGWTNAAEYNFGKGNGTQYRGKFLMGHTGDHLYIGIYEGLSSKQNPQRAVSIGFDPPNETAKAAHIYLSPPPEVKDLKTRVGSNWTNTVTPQGWEYEWIKSGNQWSVEIKIPLDGSFTGVEPGGVDLPTNPSTTFGLYVNAFTSVYISSGSNGVVQSPWPTTAEVTSGDIASNAPAPSKWGTASLGSRNKCKGVKLDVADVGTDNPNTSETQMLLGSPTQVSNLCAGSPGQSVFAPADNTFFARPENTGGSQADGVSVTFRLADWGVAPNQFNKISGGNVSPQNPVGPNSIPSNGNHKFTMDWTLTEQQVCDYDGRRHQCIQVGMRSNQPGVRFLNKAVTRNMDFTTASTFEREASIDLSGLDRPPDQESQNAVLDVTTQVQKFQKRGEEYLALRKEDLTNDEREFIRPRDSEIEGNPPLSTSLLGYDRIDPAHYPEGLVESMTWVGRVYVERPGEIEIRDREYQKLGYRGSFGVVAGHATDNVEGWSQRVIGGEVKPIEQGRNGLYQIDFVQYEPFADVGIQIKAEEDDTRREEDPGGGDDPGDGEEPGDGEDPGDGEEPGDGEKPGDGGDNGCPPSGDSTTSELLLFVGLSFIGLLVYRRRRR